MRKLLIMEPKRPHRRSINEPGHAHELTFSCYRKFPFLRAERTCLWLAEAIEAARARHAFDLFAYVFMPDHVHLLIAPRTPEYDVTHILKSIKGPVGRWALAFLSEHAPEWLPRITRQRGLGSERLFWQSGGGYDRNIYSPSILRASIDYIHANPVRRGLVARPQDWRWSSASWFDGNTTAAPLIPDRIPHEWAEIVVNH